MRLVTSILFLGLLLLAIPEHGMATSNPYLDAEIAQPFGGQAAHGTFAFEQDREIWLKKKHNAATRYVPEPFGGRNLLGPEGADVKSWVPREVPSKRRKVIKRQSQIKKLNKAAKKKPLYKRIFKKRKAKKEFYDEKPVRKHRPKRVRTHTPRKEFYDVKPTRQKSVPPPEVIKEEKTPTVIQEPEIYEEPSIDYEPERDETPLLYHENPGAVKPYQPSLWEKIKEWFSNRKFRQPNFLDVPAKQSSALISTKPSKNDGLDFLTKKENHVSIITVIKDWIKTGFTKITKKNVDVAAVEKVEEVDPCGVIKWEVPTGISSLGLRILNSDGSLSNQFTISNYISIRAGQKFLLVPRCR